MKTRRQVATKTRDLISYWPYVLVISIIGCALLWFTIWYVSSQQTIFFWDNSAYWMKVTGLAEWITISFEGAMHGVVQSIRTDEYNLLFAVPLSFVSLIFGEDRMVYILSIFILYFIPATILLGALLKRVTQNMWPKAINDRWRSVIAWGLVALNPFLILPVLIGYSDVVGLIPLCLALLLYIKTREHPKVHTLVVIALLLLVATLLRRWYIFGAVGTMLAIAVDQLSLIRRPIKYRATLLKIIKLFALPTSFIGAFLFISYDYVIQLVSTDYSYKYAAYRFHDNYIDLFNTVAERYGIVLFAVSILGIAGVMFMKCVDKRLVGVVLIPCLFAFFAVGHVQTFDTHQYYLLTPGIFLGLLAAPLVVYSFTNRTRYKIAIRAAFILIFLSLYTATGWNMYVSRIHLPGISTTSSPPKKRNDIQKLESLYERVANENRAYGETKETIYVLACSFTLNIDIFRNIPLSTGLKSSKISNDQFSKTAIFDVSQGFSRSFFDANIIIDSEPVGYITPHTGEQQIITLLHEKLKSGGDLDQYYETMPDLYSIDDGYVALLHRRTGEIPVEVQDRIVREIKATHDVVPISD